MNPNTPVDSAQTPESQAVQATQTPATAPAPQQPQPQPVAAQPAPAPSVASGLASSVNVGAGVARRFGGPAFLMMAVNLVMSLFRRKNGKI